MTSARRIVLVVLALVVLGAGIGLGFTPAKATLTEVAPELRQITVSCGNNLLRHTPSALPGDLVALPDDPSVLVPRAGYQANCDAAVGWRRWAAWGLTALGVLMLAITIAAARTPRLPGERRARRHARSSARRGGEEDSTPGSDARSDADAGPDAETGPDADAPVR